jgi:hypothetical protein
MLLKLNGRETSPPSASREGDAATNELFQLSYDACEELLADLDPRKAI